jgi:hypothetical protein
MANSRTGYVVNMDTESSTGGQSAIFFPPPEFSPADLVKLVHHLSKWAGSSKPMLVLCGDCCGCNAERGNRLEIDKWKKDHGETF